MSGIQTGIAFVCVCMNFMIKQNVMKMQIMNDYELMNDN